jgi:hypothetical protein
MIDLIDALATRGVESRVVLPAEGYVASALQARAVPYVVCRYWPWTREEPLAEVGPVRRSCPDPSR